MHKYGKIKKNKNFELISQFKYLTSLSLLDSKALLKCLDRWSFEIILEARSDLFAF